MRYEVLRMFPSEISDEISYQCFEHGCSGISEDLEFIQQSKNYIPETILQSHIHLNVYFEASPPKDFLDHLKLQHPDIEIQCLKEENKDWALSRDRF